MNYGEIITSAFRITLHNRYLWFFGFFVGLGSGGGGGKVAVTSTNSLPPRSPPPQRSSREHSTMRSS